MKMRSTIVKLEEELCEAQEKKERQEDRLLDKLCMQPRVVLHRLDVRQEYFSPEQQESEFLDVKEKESGQLLPCIKEEEDSTELPVTGVCVKSEDEEQNEENKGVEHPGNIPSQYVTSEIDGEHGGGSQADGQLAQTSDGDKTTSHSPHDGEQSEGALTCHTDSKRWKCSQCGKTLHSKFNLKRHMMGHTGEKPFACSVCGKRFSQAGTLRPHTRIHNGEKPFACLVCGQRFTRKEHLKEHTRTHSGQKPFACLVCGQRFSQRGSLTRHIRTHTAEKPFACLVCGQRFSLKEYLKEHTRTHPSEKPFACLVCGQRFSKKGDLRRHTRTHTGEKPFSCSVCGQRFTRKEHLKVHTRTHSGQNSSACLVCG